VIAASTVPVLVEFWKSGCGHCRALMTELEQLQDDMGSSLLILTMNTEENFQLSAELSITSLPALALYQNGEFVRFIGGLGKREEIARQIQNALIGYPVRSRIELQHPPGAAVMFDEAVGFHRPPGAGLVFRQPALARFLPGFENLGNPGPRGFNGVAPHKA